MHLIIFNHMTAFRVARQYIHMLHIHNFYMCFLTLTTHSFRWGQVFILDALSKYKAADARDAENIVERVTPRLQHANCAVVLSAVKVSIRVIVVVTVSFLARYLSYIL